MGCFVLHGELYGRIGGKDFPGCVFKSDSTKPMNSRNLSLFPFFSQGRDADDETLDQSEIRVWLDMSNQQIGIMLNRDLQLGYKDFAQDLLKSCDNNPKLGDVPIQFKEPIYGDLNPSFTDFVAPGVILT